MPPAEGEGEPACPRSCGLPNPLALAAHYFSNDIHWEDKICAELHLFLALLVTQ